MFICNIDPNELANVEPIVCGGPMVGTLERFKVKVHINRPEGTIGIEDFLPGTETHWAFFHHEFQYILQGEAEVTYTLVPNHDKVVKTTIKKGQAYLILLGTRATFKVTSREPYTHLWVAMPRFDMDRYLLKREYEGIPVQDYVEQVKKGR